MVEQIKLIYKLKGFDTKFFSNNKSEINTAKKSTFNFASSFKKILTNYYEKNKRNYNFLKTFFKSISLYTKNS